jgi:hypothetical protein
MSTSVAELDALIDEVTVDAYGDEEQLTGFLTGAEEALQAPEPASIVGVPLEVLKIDTGPDARRGLTAICERDGVRHEVRSPTSPSQPTASSDGWPAHTAAGWVAGSSHDAEGKRSALSVLSGYAGPVPWFT